MGWVNKNIAKKGQKVRGVIIGGNITDELNNLF